MKLSEDVLKTTEKVRIEELVGKKDPLSQARKEYKFLVPTKHLKEIIEKIDDEFLCTSHKEGLFFHYESTYFDTPDLLFFNNHRRGRPNRIKVRVREYKSGVKSSFIECKKKYKGTYTQKDRKKIGENPTKNWDTGVLENECIVKNLKKYNLTPKDLEQSMHIKYKRIFMVAKDFSKRITIDFDIECVDKKKRTTRIIPEYCVFEVKEEGIPKQIMRILRKNYKIRRGPFSKYCISMCTLNPDVRKNRWKQTLKYNIPIVENERLHRSIKRTTEIIKPKKKTCAYQT